MNMNFLLLYCALSFVNVVIQTIKSLCTVKCSTFISACVNAVAYGLYVYVIFFTNAEGLPLWSKAVITAAANFTGVYIANTLFDKVFSHEVLWKVDVSVQNIDAPAFIDDLNRKNIEWFESGHYDDWTCFSVFCPTKQYSKMLKTILPQNAKYNISECVKRL